MTGAGPISGPGGPVVVLGGGAVGSLHAVALAAAGEQVVIVDRPGRAPGPIGLTLGTPDGTTLRATVEWTDDPATIRDPAFVILAVKANQVAGALSVLAAWPGAPVVTVQNGLGAEEAVRDARPGTPLLAASLVAPVAREADGSFAWRKRRGLALAPVAGDTEATIARLRAAGSAIGLPVSVTGPWAAMKWSKLLTNLTANATCAILEMDPVTVYADRRLAALERAMMLEALATMRTLHIPVIPLPGADVRLLALGYRAPAALARPILRRVLGGARGGKMPSLALHVAADAGPTEAPWMYGAVARAARAAGVPAPVNAVLGTLMEEVARDPVRRVAFRGNPAALLAAVGHERITGREQ